MIQNFILFSATWEIPREGDFPWGLNFCRLVGSDRLPECLRLPRAGGVW